MKRSSEKPIQSFKKQTLHFANKGPSSQSYGFSSSHVWMLELDHKEGWVTKNWCFQTGVLEKTLESPWTARRSNQSILKEINPEHSLEKLMLKLKLQYFGHLMQRTDSFEKTLMLGKIEDWRRRGMTEDEMAGWHHWFSGHKFEQTPGNSEGQGSLACCSSRGCKQLDMIYWLNSSNINDIDSFIPVES